MGLIKTSSLKIIGGIGLIATGLISIKECNNMIKSNYTERMENINYVKKHDFNRYCAVMDEINSDSTTISPMSQSNIWKHVAKQIRDSIQNDSLAKLYKAETSYAKGLIPIKNNKQSN